VSPRARLHRRQKSNDLVRDEPRHQITPPPNFRTPHSDLPEVLAARTKSPQRSHRIARPSFEARLSRASFGSWPGNQTSLGPRMVVHTKRHRWCVAHIRRTLGHRPREHHAGRCCPPTIRRCHRFSRTGRVSHPAPPSSKVPRSAAPYPHEGSLDCSIQELYFPLFRGSNVKAIPQLDPGGRCGSRVRSLYGRQWRCRHRH
jgi:hypothetical protein